MFTMKHLHKVSKWCIKELQSEILGDLMWDFFLQLEATISIQCHNSRWAEQSDNYEGVLVPTGPTEQLTLCHRVTNTAAASGCHMCTFCEIAAVLCKCAFPPMINWTRRRKIWVKYVRGGSEEKQQKPCLWTTLILYFHIYAFSI